MSARGPRGQEHVENDDRADIAAWDVGTPERSGRQMAMENASSKEVWVGATVRLALDEFQTGDLAFTLAGAPRRDESSGHGIVVTLQPSGQPLKRAKTRPLGVIDPEVQSLEIA